MDYMFGSKWLINELSHLGFSISYDEVVKYKQSVIQSETLENLLSEYIPGTFTQWVADNVDHNVVSLDGQGSFHGMGIIAISSPKDAMPLHTRACVIPRLPLITANEVVKDKGLTIMQYMGPFFYYLRPYPPLASSIYFTTRCKLRFDLACWMVSL